MVMRMDFTDKDYIENYLAGLIRFPETPTMLEMRRQAEKEGYPIIRPAVAAFLNVLVNSKKPTSALEIGTSIGYSGLLILQAMGTNGRLISVESSEDLLESARENFKKQGVANQVTLIAGDGGDVLNHLDDTFGLIFLDGPKAQYLSYLPDCIRLLDYGGMLVCDDVLFYGMVAEDELIHRRKITIVKRMRKFLRTLVDYPGLDTTIVPIGNGISVSVKKEVDL